MARTSKDYDTTTKRARLALSTKTESGKPRETPYTRQIGAGKLLGYIRREDRAGTWVLLTWNGVRHASITLGLADDIVRADGESILTYEQALQKATNPVAPVKAVTLTVAAAVKSYYDIMSGSDVNAEAYRGQLNKHLTKELNETRVDRLTTTQLNVWFADLTRPKARNKKTPDKLTTLAKSSANRVLGQLKAPLNAAFADISNHIPSDVAWRLVTPYEQKKTEVARKDYLERSQVERLIASAATFDQALANLIEATYLTGARAPGELAGANVADFDAAGHTLTIRSRDDLDEGETIRRIKTGGREVTLSAEAVAFFSRCAKNKLPKAPLLPGADGQRWPRVGHLRAVKRAAKLAGLPPTTCLYTLRHAHISHAIDDGTNLKLLADNCGTSLLMIQRHYAKVLARTRNEQWQKTAPKLRVVA